MKVVHDSDKIIEIGDGDVSRFKGRYAIGEGDFNIPEYEELIELKWNGSEVVKRASDDPVRIKNAKQDKLEEIRKEAKRIITEKWPAFKQRNADAGIYPQATKDQKDQDVADVIAASNNAEDEVANATTIDEVEAVTPNWPTI